MPLALQAPSFLLRGGGYSPKTNSVRVTEMLQAARHGLDTTANLVLYARTGQENSFFVQAQPFGSRLAPSGCMVQTCAAGERQDRGKDRGKGV